MPDEDYQSEYDYANAEAQPKEIALPGDRTELIGSMIHPRANDRYKEITQDLVLANLTDTEKEKSIHTTSLLRYLENIDQDLSSATSVEMPYRFKCMEIFQLFNVFDGPLQMLINSGRGLNAKTLEAISEPRERKEITRKADIPSENKKAAKMGMF